MASSTSRHSKADAGLETPHKQDYEHSDSEHSGEDLAIRDDDGINVHKRQQPGVSRIEALYRVFPRNGAFVWTLYISLACVTICFSLDQSTTAAYQLYGASYFKDHGKLFGVIATVEAIISECNESQEQERI